MHYLARLPPLLRFLLSIRAILLIIALLTSFPARHSQLANIPKFTLNSFQLYRIWTCWTVSFNIWDWLIDSTLIILVLIPIERVYSSALLAIDFFLQVLYVQLTFSLLEFLASTLLGFKLVICSNGTLFISMVYFTKACMSNQYKGSYRRMLPGLLCLYLLALTAVQYKVNKNLQIYMDLHLGFIMAYIQECFFNGNFIRISPAVVGWVENSCLFGIVFQQGYNKHYQQGLGRGYSSPMKDGVSLENLERNEQLQV